MSYRVALWSADSLIDITTKHYMSRTQAIHSMHKLAYDKLAAFGKLDTQAAHDVIVAIDACDDILQLQESRNIKLSNTGYKLTIENTARSPR